METEFTSSISPNLAALGPAIGVGVSGQPVLSEYLALHCSRHIDHGGTVLVIEKGKATLVLPNRGGNLGIVGDDDRIVLAEVVSKGARKPAPERLAAMVNLEVGVSPSWGFDRVERSS